MDISGDLIKKSLEVEEELIKIRRELHQYPELGNEMNRTYKLVKKYLSSLGLKVIHEEKTGIIGILEGKYPGKTVLLRCDMDALPIDEIDKKDYSSRTKDRMHACGHDAHTAWGIGAAMILSQYKDRLKGNVKFAFEPSEEDLIGVNAKDMIEAGIMKDPDVDVAIAAHVFPSIDSGKIGVKAGPVTSIPGEFRIEVFGESGHASEPSNCKDPILIANNIYSQIASVKRMLVSPENPSVISVTQFHAGYSHNVIPENAIMSGTIRTFYEEDSKILSEHIEKIVKNNCEIYDVGYNFDYYKRTGPSKNDREISERVKAAGEKILGEGNVIYPPIFMGGDDFGYFTDLVPSCYFFVGTRNDEKGIIHPIHNDKFDIDESILAKTSAVISQFILDYLK